MPYTEIVWNSQHGITCDTTTVTDIHLLETRCKDPGVNQRGRYQDHGNKLIPEDKQQVGVNGQLANSS